MKSYSFDFRLLTIILLLVGIGLGYLFSVNMPGNMDNFLTDNILIIRQLISLSISFVIFIFALVFNYNYYRFFVLPLVILAFILLVLTLIPGIGVQVSGARRWLRIFQFSFQTSELAKFTLIIYLSHVLSKKDDKIQDFYKGIFPPLIITFLFAVLIFLENDFSSCFLILVVCLLIFYLAGTPYIYLISLLVVCACIFILMILDAPYRLSRLLAFLDPWEDPQGAGYHVIQSIKGFAMGGWKGVGIGNSVLKNGTLPQASHDFIFTIIGEETGLIGCLSVIFLFTYYAYRGFLLSYRARDKYTFLLASGITLLITIQTIVNIGVVIGIIPTTGLPLPFISYGGTSLLFSMLCSGILLNISIHGTQKKIKRITDDSVYKHNEFNNKVNNILAN